MHVTDFRYSPRVVCRSTVDSTVRCRHERRRRSGFALIIALSLMSFLLLLIMSLSTLVSVETQSAQSDRDVEVARKNAQLGLQLALGNLQQLAGPDRRATATADIVTDRDEGKRYWSGVWDAESWSVQEPDDRKFLGWLVSGMPVAAGMGTEQWYEIVREQTQGETVRLADGVRLTKTPTGLGGEGNYAWWIADESVKAKVNIADHYQRKAQSDAVAENARRVLPQSFDLNAVDGLAVSDELTQLLWSKAGQLYQRESVAFVDAGLAAEVRDHFHDYTLHGSGLLVDSKRGGFRKNLSHAFLDDQAFADSGLKESRIFQAEDYAAALKDGASFYGPRWEVLRDFFRIPNDLDTSGTVASVSERRGRASLDSNEPFSGRIDSLGWLGQQLPRGTVDNRREFINNPLTPVVTRIGLHYRFRAEPRGDGNYNIKFELYPRFTLWNPYNVRLKLEDGVNSKTFRILFSPSIVVWLEGESKKEFNLRGLRASGRDYVDFRLQAAGTVLEPGELRVYGMETLESDARGGSQNTFAAHLVPFHNSDAGIVYDITDRLRPDGLGIQPDAIFNLDWEIQSKFRSPSASSATEVQFWLFEVVGSETIAYQRIDSVFLNSVERISHHDTPVAGANSLETVPLEAGGIEWRLLDAGESAAHSVSPMAHFNPRAYYSGRVGGGYNNYFAPNWSWSLLNAEPAYMNFTNTGGRLMLQGDWGRGHGAAGSSRVVLFDVPRKPPLSLGQLQHASLSPYANTPAYALGNSLADPHVGRSEIARKDGEGRHFYDISWLLNDALWDGFFFTGKGSAAVDFAAGEVLPNARLVPANAQVSSQTLDSVEDAAANLRIDGAFNVNSTSVKAWSAFLGSGGGEGFAITNAMSGAGANLPATQNPFWRLVAPTDTDQNSWYGGFRDLSKVQIDALATAMVDEVKARGPFMNLADFVNRRLVSGDEGLKGALQAAIDATTINNQVVSDTKTASASYPQAGNAATSQGANAPGYLTQADVLTSVGPFITTRGDTFLIRAYGDSVGNNGEVLAKAWLEAVVERTAETLEGGTPFGRAFRVVSMRWLNEDEL